MLFNSLTFVVFFAVVLTLYWSMRSWNGRKNLLLVASSIRRLYHKLRVARERPL